MIYLPPCYAQRTDQLYPVLYLFHGQYYQNDQWVRLGALSTADRLIASGEVPPFIIVLPYDPSPRQPSEYPFAEAINSVAVPYIDQHYLTRPERAFRAVGGLSRGAGWAIHLGVSRPDLFGAVGAHSPIVLAEDGGKLAGWMRAIKPEEAPRFFLDIGDRDNDIHSALWFEGLLTEYGFFHEWHMYVGYHSETYWAAHVEEYLRWYVSNWDVEVP